MHLAGLIAGSRAAERRHALFANAILFTLYVEWEQRGVVMDFV